MNVKIGAVIVYNDKILVVKRSKESGGFWQTITGSVEDGETLREALDREIYEETRLTGTSSYPSLLHSFIWYKKEVEYLEIIFLFNPNSDKVILSDEHTDFKWLEPKKAKEKVKMESNKIVIQKTINL